MCGIAGIVSYSGLAEASFIRAMMPALDHRGPDDRGFLLWTSARGVRLEPELEQLEAAEAFFAHQRLSILDLSKAGWQPMSSSDGRYHLIFNGEIYNYLELKAELKAHGYCFKSNSDSEVLLNAYSHWGKDCLNKLVGMFAFAVLDCVAKKVFLARDSFGVKPLYYCYWQQGVAFASEIAPLLELPGVSRKVNKQRFYEYLRYSGITDHGSETMFQDIEQLPAAHYTEFFLEQVTELEPVRYWRLDFSGRTDLSFDKAAEQLKELFLESVQLHLRSDVPVGAALSGGIDSSSIVMAMRHLVPDLDLHAFSYIADDDAINEERYIDCVASAASVKLRKVSPQANDLVRDLEQLVSLQNEPFGSTSIYAQYKVFELAKAAGVKVMLDGQGADEQLGGYPIYSVAWLASLMRNFKISDAFSFWQVLNKQPQTQALLSHLPLYFIPPESQTLFRALKGKNYLPAWLNKDWFDQHKVDYRALQMRYSKEALHDLLHHTLSYSSVPMLLRYEDRNSMIHSIESRVPFLTPQLAQFLFTLPGDYLISKSGLTKAVFRQAMRGIVPDLILDRRDKIGFQTPEQRWLKTLAPFINTTLESDEAKNITALQYNVMIAEWQAVCKGTKAFDNRIWRWVNAISWAKQFRVNFD